MRKILLSGIVFLSVLCFLCGCSEKKGKKYTGTILTVNVNKTDIDYPADRFYEGGAALTLYKDGKGKLQLGKTVSGISYEINGDEFTMLCDGIPCSGYFRSGMIGFRNFLDAGSDIIFAEEGIGLSEDQAVICEDGILGDYSIRFIGADPIKVRKSHTSDEEVTEEEQMAEEDAVLVIYDFTNHSSQAISPKFALEFTAYQNGERLENGYSEYENELYANQFAAIQPGVTIRCAEQYLYDPAGGSITAEAFCSDYSRGYRYISAFDASNMPSVSKEWTIPEVKDPKYAEGKEAGGSIGNYEVAINDAESFEDANGSCLRAVFTFKNISGKEIAPWNATKVKVFQDGVRLKLIVPEKSKDIDNVYLHDVYEGKELEFAYVFQLRNNNPVVVEISDTDGKYLFAKRFDLDQEQ